MYISDDRYKRAAYYDGYFDYLGGRSKKQPRYLGRKYLQGMSTARTMLNDWESERGKSYRDTLSVFHAEQKVLQIKDRSDCPCFKCEAAVFCRDWEMACQMYFHWASKAGGRWPTKRTVPNKQYYEMVYKHG